MRLFITSLLSVLLVNSAAMARDFNRNGTVHSSTGRSGSFTSEGTRTKGHREGTRTYTGENGTSRTRHFSGDYDKTTGAFQRTSTGENGKTRAVSGTRNANGTSSGNFTNARGETGTFTGQRTRNADGSVSHEQTITRPNGEVVTRSSTVTRQPDGSVTRDIRGPRGHTRQITGSTSDLPAAGQ